MIPILPTHLSPKPDDPAPVSWSDFSTSLRQRWNDFLASEPTEEAVQSFLERCPCLLPRPYVLFGGGHHGPFPSAVITQPVLPSYAFRRPDFMWLAADSMNYWAVLIEIERPSKRWFTAKGVQTASLTQALGQLQEWRQWFSHSRNQEAFLNHYQVPIGSHHVFRCHHVLIFGRRAEANQGGNGKRRSFIDRPDETLMTFDRLEPDTHLADVITVRHEADGYRALCSQPTIDLHRFNVTDWQYVADVDKVILANPEIPADRKTYLLNLRGRWHEQLEKERLQRSRAGLPGRGA